MVKYTLCICAVIIILGATFISVMYADYILQLAKSKTVPVLNIAQADYVSVTEKQVIVDKKEIKKE
ncbi:MAG: hypothetical protein DRH26_02215 [Deltaproteobacteria bacterium]|nr:MAG: hypothetical protein DRH26_02215 [Deltaproteobacteria bacterium]